MEAIALIDVPLISAVTDEVRDINTAEPRATSTILTAAPEADTAGMTPVPIAGAVCVAVPTADSVGIVEETEAGSPSAAVPIPAIWIAPKPDRLLTWASCAAVERTIGADPKAPRTNEAVPEATNGKATARAIAVPEVSARPLTLIPTEAPPDALAKPWAVPDDNSAGIVAKALAASTWPTCALATRRSNDASPVAPPRCTEVAATLMTGIATLADALSNCCAWAVAVNASASVPEKNICRKARDAQESAGTVARPDPNVVDVRFGTMISAASRNPKASAAITRGVTASLSSRGGVGFWTDITSMDASPNARHWTTIIDTADSGRIVIAVEADEPIEPLALRSMLALPDVSDRWEMQTLQLGIY
jgi:hypothetical protein